MKVKRHYFHLATMLKKSDIWCNLYWTTFVMNLSIRHPSGFLIKGSGQVCLLERCLVILRQPYQSVLMRVPFIIPSSGPWRKHLRYQLNRLCITVHGLYSYRALLKLRYLLKLACGVPPLKLSTNNGRPNTLTSWFISLSLNRFVTKTVRGCSFGQTK